MSEGFDALVIGGGPAGSAAALLLVRAGWSVLLLEKRAFPRRKVCGEYLSATTLPLLDRLGLGEAFRDRAGPPVDRVGLFAGPRCLSAALPCAAVVVTDLLQPTLGRSGGSADHRHAVRGHANHAARDRGRASAAHRPA